MRTQFHAIAVDIDQKSGLNGVIVSRHGRLSEMRAFIGQYPGSATRFFSEADYEIGIDSEQGFRDDQGTPVPGKIYALAERER